jgi:hypothetical protein
MGSIDDNVPPYMMRRMARLLDELNQEPHYVEVSEIPGEGHWFNGVVDDAIMQSFFNRYVNTTIPSLPNTFQVC